MPTVPTSGPKKNQIIYGLENPNQRCCSNPSVKACLVYLKKYFDADMTDEEREQTPDIRSAVKHEPKINFIFVLATLLEMYKFIRYNYLICLFTGSGDFHIIVIFFFSAISKDILEPILYFFVNIYIFTSCVLFALAALSRPGWPSRKVQALTKKNYKKTKKKK